MNKPTYRKVAKRVKDVVFFVEADSRYIDSGYWSKLGLCTPEAAKELYDFLEDWQKRHRRSDEYNAKINELLKEEDEKQYE